MFEVRRNDYSSRAGLFAFFWRLVLTTSTGLIFELLDRVVGSFAHGPTLLAGADVADVAVADDARAGDR